MGLYDAMNASVTGMNAQSNYLTNIGQNISNSNTTGYKQADTEFSTLVNSTAVGQTATGGVQTSTRLLVDKQGTLTGTTSATDLAVSGDGFFVVQDSAGQNYLTRAGSFIKDNSGNLVNGAGYYLMGYSTLNGATPTMASNSLTGMTKVVIGSGILPATASTKGTFAANLPSTDAIGAGAPATSANYTQKTSIVMYDSLGTAQTVNIYFTKTAANAWSASAYDSTNTLIAGSTTALAFSAAGVLPSAPATTMSFTVPGSGASPMKLDLTSMTQYSSAYSVSTSTVDGNAASSVSSVSVATNGTLSYQLADGTTISAYKIPLASVTSPDNLLAVTGNVFSPNILSGQATVGVAGTGQLGTIKSSTLEGSTVDVATELTNMIVAQRNYQANSKMFQTGATLLGTLINMQV
jgi:flagellar hook protein FlgE